MADIKSGQRYFLTQDQYATLRTHSGSVTITDFNGNTKTLTALPAEGEYFVIWYSNARGPQGLQGPKGDKGDKGAASTVPGPVGPVGPAGPQGVSITQVTGSYSTVDGEFSTYQVLGSDGKSKGTIKVKNGSTGKQGQQGPVGPAGPKGADSTVPGPQGLRGPRGEKGNTGDRGPQGVPGFSVHVAINDIGGNGSAGITGSTSLSNLTQNAKVQIGDIVIDKYHYNDSGNGELGFWEVTAIQGGTVTVKGSGTLLIDRGPQGNQGVQGPPGPQGNPGNTGPTGPTGQSAFTIYDLR